MRYGPRYRVEAVSCTEPHRPKTIFKTSTFRERPPPVVVRDRALNSDASASPQGRSGFTATSSALKALNGVEPLALQGSCGQGQVLFVPAGRPAVGLDGSS